MSATSKEPRARRSRILFGITGASGSVYARMLLQELLKLDVEIHLIVSPTSLIVFKEEMGLEFTEGQFNVDELVGAPVPEGRVTLHNYRDLAAGPASGTFRAKAMVVCPCSMRTLGTIASCTGNSLVTRAADACLKERRRLVLVPRETPLNLIHLRNMVTLSEAGAVILPAMPGYYHRPKSIDDLVRHVVLKILDALELEHSIGYRWKDSDFEDGE